MNPSPCQVRAPGNLPRVLTEPRIIILNGVGSVGKTSTARALQVITAEPFLHASMDVFAGMLPAAMFGDPEGLLFEKTIEDGRPSIIIRTGPVFERAMHGMRHAIAAMAGQGNNLIVDDVMLSGEARDYRTLLAGFDVRYVGLFAPLDVLEGRERARRDREIGLARWQYGRVHQGVAYDLEIDTTETTPEENARIIRDSFDL